MKIIKKVYNNRVDRLLVSCVVEKDGLQQEVDVRSLVSLTHKFENATGVFSKNMFYIRRKSNYPEIPEVYLEDINKIKLWYY